MAVLTMRLRERVRRLPRGSPGEEAAEPEGLTGGVAESARSSIIMTACRRLAPTAASGRGGLVTLKMGALTAEGGVGDLRSLGGGAVGLDLGTAGESRVGGGGESEEEVFGLLGGAAWWDVDVVAAVLLSSSSSSSSLLLISATLASSQSITRSMVMPLSPDGCESETPC